MIIYTGALVWILFIGLFTQKIWIEQSEDQIGFRYTYVEALMMMAYLVFFTGLRSSGADTDAYIKGYEDLPVGVSKMIAAISEEEGLFRAFGIAVKTFISSNYTPYLFLIALITGIAIALAFKKGTPYLSCAMILFILNGYWVWMINGCRQFLAAALAFMAAVFLSEKQTVKNYALFVIIIFILSGIHTSVLLLIPTYFLAKSTVLSKRTILVLLIAVFAIFFTSRFTLFLSTALEDTTYGNIMNDIYYMGDTGSNKLRTFIYAIPVIMAYYDRENISENAPPIIRICVNMSFIAMCVSMIANVTSGIYMGRLVVYFSIFNIPLLAWIMHDSRMIFERDLLRNGLYIFYGIYFIYAYYIHSQLYYSSEILGLAIK